MTFKITCRRKKSKSAGLVIKASKTKELYLNQIKWSTKRISLSDTFKDVKIVQELLRQIPVAKYYVRVTGGGIISQVQVLQKVLVSALPQSSIEVFKTKYPSVFSFDHRRNLPIKYGGPGARARYQKSYR